MSAIGPDLVSAPRVIVSPGRAFKGRRPSLGVLVNARLLRLLIGLGLVSAAAWYMYLYAFNKVSIAGVVNAPLVTIVSQLDGRVIDSTVGRSTMLKLGQAIATVVNDRVDDRTVTDLAASLRGARERLTAQRVGIAELTALRAELERRGQEHSRAWVEHLEKEVTETEAALASQRIGEQQARDASRRAVALAANGTVSRVNHDDIAYAHQRAAAEVNRARAALTRREQDLAAARDGIMLGDGNWSDVPYSRQRLDEIDIRLAGLRNEESGLIATIAETEAKLAAETARFARLSREELVAPVEGFVWRSTIAPGSAVVHGTPLFELIDCNRIYVEATTRERFFESLTPGRRVRVRLEGGDRDIAGSIRAIVGPGASLTTASNVSVIRQHSGTDAQLIVDIDRAELPPAGGSTCNVGRSAKVYFD